MFLLKLVKEAEDYSRFWILPGLSHRPHRADWQVNILVKRTDDIMESFQIWDGEEADGVEKDTRRSVVSEVVLCSALHISAM